MNSLKWHRCLLSLSVLAVLVATAGCGGVDGKAVVEGTASYAGHRIINGDIRFVPAEGGVGAASSAPIVDGVYQIVNKGGVPAGRHKVFVRAFMLEGIGSSYGNGAGEDLLSGQGGTTTEPSKLPIHFFEGRPQFIPPKYNATTTLTAEVTGEENPQIIDFALEP